MARSQSRIGGGRPLSAAVRVPGRAHPVFIGVSPKPQENERTMRTSFHFCGRRAVAGFNVLSFLLMCQPTVQTIQPIQSTGAAHKVDSLIRRLHAPEGKITPLGSVFLPSAPMQKL